MSENKISIESFRAALGKALALGGIWILGILTVPGIKIYKESQGMTSATAYASDATNINVYNKNDIKSNVICTLDENTPVLIAHPTLQDIFTGLQTGLNSSDNNFYEVQFPDKKGKWQSGYVDKRSVSASTVIIPDDILDTYKFIVSYTGDTRYYLDPTNGNSVELKYGDYYLTDSVLYLNYTQSNTPSRQTARLLDIRTGNFADVDIAFAKPVTLSSQRAKKETKIFDGKKLRGVVPAGCEITEISKTNISGQSQVPTVIVDIAPNQRIIGTSKPLPKGFGLDDD